MKYIYNIYKGNYDQLKVYKYVVKIIYRYNLYKFLKEKVNSENDVFALGCPWSARFFE